MIDNRNIPDADQSWAAAEKMLDRHFRKRRLLIWLISLVIPVMITGVLLTYNQFTENSDGKIVYTNESSLTAGSDATTIGNAGIVEDAADANIDVKNKFSGRAAENTVVADNTEKTAGDDNFSGKIGSKVRRPQSITGVPASVSSVNRSGGKNKEDIDRNFAKGENPAGVSPDVYSSSKVIKQENVVEIKGPATETSKINLEEIVIIDSKNFRDIEIENMFSPREISWPKVVDYKTKSHITWEATAYGAAHMVNKTVTADKEMNNYLQHRKYEEDAIVTPTTGLAVTASFNSLSLSIGAEFSTYGEKTKYFPFSNQQVITDVSTWNSFVVNVIDTDTVYIWGNQRLIETIYQELDSVFVLDQDTTEEYKYDKKIAETNGVNRFYYVEVPVEVSYTLTKGKAGVGVSGGVSPAWLMHQKGYYIKTNGNGVEPISEIKTFRKFMINARFSVDLYYRLGGRTKLVLRPQFKTNLNSVFNDDYGVKQKYFSTGLVFGVSYMLN